jgi:hypothetical protein
LLAQVVYIDLVGKAEGAAKEALFAGIELSCAQSQSPARFPIEELLERYREHLTEKVSRVLYQF